MKGYGKTATEREVIEQVYRKLDALTAQQNARLAVKQALRCGLLVPAPVCAMPECKQWRVEAHHVCYERTWWLEVIWLCRRCHRRLHAEHRRKTLQTRRDERREWHKALKLNGGIKRATGVRATRQTNL